MAKAGIVEIVDVFSKRVRAFFSTRNGGVSKGNYSSLNLGNHVDDDWRNTDLNRSRFSRAIECSKIVWMNQTHSNKVKFISKKTIAQNTGLNTTYGPYYAYNLSELTFDCDGIVTDCTDVALAVMTADCLPLLLATEDGSIVGAIHCGWKGLSRGIVKKAIDTIKKHSDKKIIAYMGPAIGPQSFEVGEDVREIFLKLDSKFDKAFCKKEYTDEDSVDEKTIACEYQEKVCEKDSLSVNDQESKKDIQQESCAFSLDNYVAASGNCDAILASSDDAFSFHELKLMTEAIKNDLMKTIVENNKKKKEEAQEQEYEVEIDTLSFDFERAVSKRMFMELSSGNFSKEDLNSEKFQKKILDKAISDFMEMYIDRLREKNERLRALTKQKQEKLDKLKQQLAKQVGGEENFDEDLKKRLDDLDTRYKNLEQDEDKDKSSKEAVKSTEAFRHNRMDDAAIKAYLDDMAIKVVSGDLLVQDIKLSDDPQLALDQVLSFSMRVNQRNTQETITKIASDASLEFNPDYERDVVLKALHLTMANSPFAHPIQGFIHDVIKEKVKVPRGSATIEQFINRISGQDKRAKEQKKEEKKAVEIKYMCNIYLLCEILLQQEGVKDIHCDYYDTYSQTDKFFSYRRQKVTGRMASAIYLRDQ